MITFGLVHGAGLGGWCWEGTIRELEARGCQSAAVDLPFADPSVGATRHAEIILDAFGGLDELVLVGHSMSGLVVPLVAAQRTLRRLIFLHAALPQPGMSFDEQVKSDPDLFNSEMLSVPPTAWADPATAVRFLYHDCDPEIAREVCARLRMPEGGRRVLATEVTPLQAWPNLPTSYILCREDRTITPGWARRAARERLHITPLELPGGHCPMFSRPAELADALVRCLDS